MKLFKQSDKSANRFLKKACNPAGIALLLLFNILPVYAQQTTTITGVVVDTKGEAVAGASILIKGSAVATLSDTSGRFDIQAAPGTTVVVSLLGYHPQEIPVGDQTALYIILEEAVQQLEEVVVTALGIKRERRTLGYAVQEVKTVDFTETKTESVANMLQGKLAGVQISQSSTGVGGSTRIILRGSNSLTGRNQPLWVVDGIPIRDDAPGASFEDGGAGSDVAGASSEINPDDIATISVLKGPNASALYGSRAQNGVIVITTKSAGQEQPLRITYNGHFSWSQLYNGYDFQWLYGQGTRGGFDISAREGWGPLMTGQKIQNWREWYYNEAAEEYAMTAQQNRINDFFRTGFNSSNSVAIEGGGKYLATRLSFTDSRYQGITANSALRRQYVDINSNLKYGRLTVNAKATYSKQIQENPVITGEYGMMQMFTRMPANIRTEDLVHNMTLDHIPMNWSGPSNEYMNPYNYITDEKETIHNRDRLFGVISASFKVTEWLNVTARTGMDRIMDNNHSWGLKGTNGTSPVYGKSYAVINELNSDLMLNINKTVGRFSVLANAGAAVMNLKTDGLDAGSGYLTLYGFYRLSNGSLVTADDYTTEKEIQSVLGNVQLAYNNYLYLDMTARNDWSSTLHARNRSYFYSSVNLSGIVSDMVNLPKQISLLKVRASWAQVGNDTDPYRLTQVYSLPPKVNGVNMWGDVGLIKPFDDLKPERTTSFEFGLDLNLFQNRIGLDFTYYHSSTINQILSLPVPPSSGYEWKFINAGKMKSSGFELALSTTPVKSGAWQWDVTVNWGTNTSQCVALTPGIQKLALGSLRIGEVVVMEGGQYGDIRSKVFIRDEAGRMLVDDDGIPRKSNEFETIGNISPDWTGAVISRLQYKNFVVNVLIDIRQGGDILSVTDALASEAGTGARTVDGRGGMIVEGVTSSGQPNTKTITAQQYWQSVGGAYGVGEAFLYDGSFVKLREVSLGYNIPTQYLNKIKFIRQAKLSLVGRDLFYFLKHTPGTDPEGASVRADWAQAFELNALPPARTFGFNLNLTF
ncbi:MAG: SusC/RagA family TonB-linked outer membrane protein [Prevotellaceae bacterium]|jgi:TonB-linked SusC/RagA family outer membrane protein|nr:SusC/RagA family TonB-linked outer membrane protein [Prevotellaceae bacterium]